MKYNYLTGRYVIILATVVISIDQLSKIFVLSLRANSIIIVPKLLKLTMIKNTGAAFNILSNNTNFLSLISLIVSLILIFIILSKPKHPFLDALAYSFLLAGSIGNGIDRFRLGYVIDFIHLTPINFPIFNIADISINIAIICILLKYLIQKKARNNEQTQTLNHH